MRSSRNRLEKVENQAARQEPENYVREVVVCLQDEDGEPYQEVYILSKSGRLVDKKITRNRIDEEP